MQRLKTIIKKELADHFGSYRFAIIFALIAMVSLITAYMVGMNIRKEGEPNWQLALEQEPVAQAALLCIEAQTGHVKAMVAGRDFFNSQFNRAFQSRRQPGRDCPQQTYKPIKQNYRGRSIF